jgi:hypothetical protein
MGTFDSVTFSGFFGLAVIAVLSNQSFSSSHTMGVSSVESPIEM